MIRLNRPPEPPDFHTHVKVAHAAAIAWSGVGKFTFKNKWRRYARHFKTAQRRSCAFCEGKIRTGDIEHYRPKSRVARWHPPTPPGRPPKKPPLPKDHGYRWLAYKWDNYLFSCADCNRRWKRDLFPIAGTRATSAADDLAAESPQLINPYDSDPAPHFYFDSNGGVHGRSDRGRWSVAIYGLDDPELSNDRCDQIEQARAHVVIMLELLASQPTDAQIASLVNELKQLYLEPGRLFSAAVGSVVVSEIAHYTGVSRAVVRTTFGLP